MKTTDVKRQNNKETKVKQRLRKEEERETTAGKQKGTSTEQVAKKVGER